MEVLPQAATAAKAEARSEAEATYAANVADFE